MATKKVIYKYKVDLREFISKLRCFYNEHSNYKVAYNTYLLLYRQFLYV